MDNHPLRLASDILDAIELAHEAHALLPPLPQGVKPVYFRLLHTLYRIRDEQGCARVSDINKTAGLLLPNTTKCIGEMVTLGIVEKTTHPTDKRVVLVKATALGEAYIQNNVLGFQEGLQKEFEQLDEQDCRVMIATLNQVCEAMKRRYMKVKSEG